MLLEDEAALAAFWKTQPGGRPHNEIIALNPGARPGLSVGGGGSLIVGGGVAVNSEGGGVDEFGQSVNSNTGTAASVANNSTFRATSIQTVGGVNTPANFEPYDPDAGNPLDAKSLTHPDPYVEIPPPTTANGSCDRLAAATFRMTSGVSGKYRSKQSRAMIAERYCRVGWNVKMGSVMP